MTSEQLEELGERGFSIRESPAGGEPRAAVTPGQRHLRRLPRRAVRPRRQALSLPVHQLHQLRAALHDRARRALRPAEHDDGRRSRCARRAAPSTRTRRTAASTPSPTPARTAARRCGSCTRAGARSRTRARATRSRPPRARCSTGAIVAVKGIGGFHLACRADDEAAVAELRARKHREDKPFALMAPDARRGPRARGPEPPELELLLERARPIVLAARRPGRRGCGRRGAGSAGARRDAAVLAAPPPAAGRRGHHARDDERQRLRRADRLPRRGRLRAARRASPTSS